MSVFVREDLVQTLNVTCICHEFSNCVVLYMKCSMFKLMKDIILYVAHVSTEGSPMYGNFEESNGILVLENNIAAIKQRFPDCYIYLAGDFNARTKDFPDFISSDDLDHIHNLQVDEEDTFEMPRGNEDNGGGHLFGKTLVDVCCIPNSDIVNCRLYDE